MSKISLHHIGGRGGDRAFPFLKSFEKDIINVLYDADKDCVEDIVEKAKNIGSELHVFPYCVGGVNAKTSFNLNYDPYTSSILPLNQNYRDYYYFNHGSDYIIGETFRAVRSVDIDTVTLDAILKTNDVQKPDFLSIDTQGAEYDILSGAEELLDKNILAVQLEVEFKPLYKDQKLFGDIDGLITARGFEFIGFTSGILQLSPYRAPIGLRAEGHSCATDALYFKKASAIGNKTYDDFIKLMKLAFFSIAFRQLEAGLKYLSMAQEMAGAQEMREKLSGYSYTSFLFELDRRAAKIKKEYPLTFSQRHSVAESYSRFIVDKKHQETATDALRKRIVAVLKKNSLLCKTLENIRRRFRNTLRANAIWRKTSLDNIKMSLTKNSPVEKLLEDYGFDELCRIVKARRLKEYGFRKVTG